MWGEQCSPAFVRLNEFTKKAKLTTSITGRRGRRPLQLHRAAKSLRSMLTFTLCLCTTLVSFANSSLLIPHSSFFIPHFYLFSPQHQYPDNIRHCHKSIENIRHSPHKLHAPHRSNAPTSYRHDPIDHITSWEKISPCPLPYEKPPCHCR